jgi:hypothetical protein
MKRIRMDADGTQTPDSRPQTLDQTDPAPQISSFMGQRSSSDDTVHPDSRLVVPLLHIELLAGDSVLRVGWVEPQGG